MIERLKQMERTWWWRWPEWLCALLTRHKMAKQWARYDLDVSGKSCRCGWYSEYRS